MIKTNELRVNNWVYSFAEYTPLSGMESKEGVLLPVQITLGNIGGRYEGIELTPEILAKCGFALVGKEWQVKVSYTECFEWHEGKLFYTGGEGVRLGVGCQYLHQLQNLYFCLTGEELNVEL